MNWEESSDAWRALAVRLSIIAAMAVGSVAIWVANPVVWLWVASHLQSESHRVGLAPYAVLLAGVVATAVILAIVLARLNRLYARVTGAPPGLRVVLPWHRSMRDVRQGGPDEPGRRVSVLDVVMTISVGLCVAAFLVWYFVTDPTPPGVSPGGSKD